MDAKNLTYEYSSKLLIRPLLYFLIVFSPFIHGGITYLPLFIIEAVIFLIFLIFFAGFIQEKEIIFAKAPALFLALFLILVLFQLLPLPGNLLSLLSPSTFSLYRDFSFHKGINYVLSICPEDTLAMFLQCLSASALFFVLVNYLNSERRIKSMVYIIVITGFLYAFFGFIRKFSTPFGGFSTFTNSNHFAAYEEMIVPIAITLAFIETNKLKRVILFSCAAVMGTAIFLSLSRAGILSFSFSMLLLTVLLRVNRIQKKAAIMIGALFILISLFLVLIGFSPITKKLNTIKDPLKAMHGRIEVIMESPRIIKDFPLFGTGLGTFSEIFQKYKTFSEKRAYRFSHSEPIQLLIETGVIGFLLLGLFLFFHFKAVFSLWVKRRNPFASCLTLGCYIGLLSIALHSFFDFVLHVPANLVLLFCLFALTWRTVYIKKNQDELPVPGLRIGFSLPSKIFCLLAVFIFFVFIESMILKRYQAEAAYEKYKNIKVSGMGIEALFEYRKNLKEIDTAIALNNLNSRYFDLKATILTEAMMREDTAGELSNFEDFKSREEVLSQAEMLYKQAVNLNPTNAGYHFRLGWLYGLMGRDDLEGQEFNKALVLDPQNTEIRKYIYSSGGL